MSESELIEHMSALATQIAANGNLAITIDPAKAPALIELAMSAATGLDIGRRLLIADGDTKTAMLMIGCAHGALNVIAGILQSSAKEATK